MNDPDELLDIRQAAELLKVSETSLRRWTNAGRLASFRVGRRHERRFRVADLLAFMEAHPPQPAAGNGGADRTVHHAMVRGAPIETGSHLCGLYASDVGRTRLAVSFLIDGLHPGSACLLIAPPEVREGVLEELDRSHPDLRGEIDAGRLVLSKHSDSADAQYAYFRTELVRAMNAGARSLRVVGDMWRFDQTIGDAALMEYEAGYERLIARRFPLITLCQYDLRAFAGAAIVDALRAHEDTFRYPAARTLA